MFNGFFYSQTSSGFRKFISNVKNNFSKDDFQKKNIDFQKEVLIVKQPLIYGRV
jgi:hypothetical protein